MHYSPTPTFADVKFKNRINNYDFKSHMVHNNEYNILQQQINALTAAIMIDVINNLSQDIRTPMMKKMEFLMLLIATVLKVKLME